MNRILTCAMLLAVCLGSAPYASATWGKFISTGTATGVGNPSCAFVSTGHVVCAVLTDTAAIMVNEFNGTAWGKWTSLSGAVSSSPSCTSDGDGSVICGATATNGNLLWTIFNGTKWSTPATVAAALYSAPSCAQYSVGEVLCVARNATAGLAWSLYNGTSWSAFAKLTTTAVSAPACTTDNNGGVVCSIFTTAYVTRVNRFAAGAWKGFLSLGGDAGGEPDCASFNSSGRVACFAKAYNSGIYVDLFDGTSWATGDWSGYEGLGGAENDNASCASQAAGELVCGVISAITSGFFANVDAGSGFTGWVAIGTTTGLGSPSCAPLGTSQVVCVVMGTNNKLSSVVGP
jgi:hypothetical protein